MSRVITFSRTFPAHHPKKGQPTFFVEKFRTAMSILNMNTHVGDVLAALPAGAKPAVVNFNAPKYHTIRKLKKPFKVGDKFSPRYWGNDVNPKSGRSGPYKLAANDGLTVSELMGWFNKPFTGQIICWKSNLYPFV